MSKKILIIITILVLLIAGVILYVLWRPEIPSLPSPQTAEKTNTATFACDNNNSIRATFYPDNDTRVDLVLNDGRTLSVPHATSASGARYANTDESFVFWNKGDTAFITENGTTTHANCIMPDAYKNIAYSIEGSEVTLTGGVSEMEAAPGSASKIITKYFGNELRTDLNNDGREDIVFLLTQETGGSGVFFYAVAAVRTDAGYVGSDGYLLGDRIAPQTTNVSQNPKQKNVIVVNYADRNPGEPMTTRPSLGKSAYLKLDPQTMQWGIVVPDFEGESR